ncbi:MAG: hypothetical protein Q9162_004824 [Coniocarpon cinnabarinum]
MSEPHKDTEQKATNEGKGEFEKVIDFFLEYSGAEQVHETIHKHKVERDHPMFRQDIVGHPRVKSKLDELDKKKKEEDEQRERVNANARRSRFTENFD